MSIVTEILEELWEIKLSYKGVPTRALFISVPWEDAKSYKSTLYRMHKKGFVHKETNGWKITKSGKEYLSKQKKLFIQFDSPFTKSSPKNLLLMFDVPEERNSERQWLRFHLKRFNYYMIQKSVWVGPSPLPSKFKSYLKELKLDSCIKIFKLAKPYKVN